MLQDQKMVVQLIVPALDEIMHMIEKNIFRPLPGVKKAGLQYSETGVEQEDEVDPAWPHLQGVYDLFLQLVVNDAIETKAIKTYVTPQFVQEFLVVRFRGVR